jgi:outer membrane protein
MIVRLLFPCVMLGMLALQARPPNRKLPRRTPKPPPTSVSAKEYSADLMSLYRESRLEDPRVPGVLCPCTGQ